MPVRALAALAFVLALCSGCGRGWTYAWTDVSEGPRARVLYVGSPDWRNYLECNVAASQPKGNATIRTIESAEVTTVDGLGLKVAQIVPGGPILGEEGDHMWHDLGTVRFGATPLNLKRDRAQLTLKVRARSGDKAEIEIYRFVWIRHPWDRGEWPTRDRVGPASSRMK